MKHLSFVFFIMLAAMFSCSSQQQAEKDIVKSNFGFASEQLIFAMTEIDKAIAEESPESKKSREVRGWGELVNPRTINKERKLELVASRDWTSGFYPGELWYMYEYTKDKKWEELARKYTDPLECEKTNGNTHDMGFKIYCSFGNGNRLTKDNRYKDIMLESAYTLITRYNPAVGCIRSWDHNSDKWQYPVIIDNMMNLELLFWASRESGNPVFYDIAVNHARTTTKNHFRNDYSTYHVIDYDTITGEVMNKHTHQGYAHESAWSRGQAWGLYGYTMCYRETKLPEFLEQAKRIANYIFTHPNLPEDLIPYWDFNAPAIPNEPRDVSAATITASALYELSLYDKENATKYIEQAETILKNLSENYLAKKGGDRGFLLLHSTGSKPANSEVDVPLVYADYYFLEALLRKQSIATK